MPGIHAVSALTGEGIGALLAAISDALDEERLAEEVALPFSDGRRRAWLHEAGVVTDERQDDAGVHVSVRWTARQKAAFEAL